MIPPVDGLVARVTPPALRCKCLTKAGAGGFSGGMTDPTDTELADRYRTALEEERAALLTASEDTGEGRKPVMLDQAQVGRLSRMDAMQGQAMEAALEARRHGRIRAIDAALRRIEEGEFGWCDDCGSFIGFGRLDSDAAAMRCISCAS